ncbi:MAG: phospholipid carrier-dependent glycosyltransferase, partial [Candidatus Binataceae bacterium]
MTPLFNRRRFFLAAAAVVMLAAALVFHRLGAADVCGANEAVEGVVVQQMVEHGALVFPMLNRREPMYKPPLFHWTATALDRALGVGKVTAFNLRMPSALYAVAGVALTIAFAAAILPASGAILSGLILTGSYQYVSQGRVGRVDMTLAFFETLALFVFLWWFLPRGDCGAEKPPLKGDGWLLYLLALALGLGVLAKGPVGAILPALAIAIFLMIERRERELAAMLRPGPVILALAIGSSWYLTCFFGNRYGLLHRQLGSENFGRFFGALGMMPPWYYLMPILLNSAPLSLLVPIAVVDAMRSRRSGAEPGTGVTAAQRARLSVHLLAIFWIVTVAFFTLAAYKRRAYLLPLWPASAVM